MKFLLATTDPKRLPITILSRCLQFHLKRVAPEQITQHLQHICETETIPFETSALELLTKAADGSMRDALSLLDQTIAYCGQKISLTETRTLLGGIEQEALFRLLHALAEKNGNTLLNEIAALSEYAPDFNSLLEELLSLLHQISIAQILSETTHESIQALAKQFSPEDIQLYYQIALIGRRDLALAPNPQQGFEMIMIRMLAFKPVEIKPEPQKKVRSQDLDEALSAGNRGGDAESRGPRRASGGVAKASDPRRLPAESASSKVVSQDSNMHLEKNINWTSLLPQLKLSGMAQVLASNCIVKNSDDSKIELILSAQHEPMLNKKLIERITQALTQHFNKTIQLEIKIAAEEIRTPAKQQQEAKTQKQSIATQTIQNDVHVKTLLNLFDATLDMNSIKAT